MLPVRTITCEVVEQMTDVEVAGGVWVGVAKCLHNLELVPHSQCFLGGELTCQHLHSTVPIVPSFRDTQYLRYTCGWHAIGVPNVLNEPYCGVSAPTKLSYDLVRAVVDFTNLDRVISPRLVPLSRLRLRRHADRDRPSGGSAMRY